MKNSQKGSTLIILLVIVIILLVLIFGVYVYLQNNQNLQKVNSSQSTIQVTQPSVKSNVAPSQPSIATSSNIKATVTISGTSFKSGDKVTITWSGKIVPVPGELPAVDLFSSQDRNFNFSISGPISGNTYVWTVPSTIKSGSYYVQVYNENDVSTGAKSSIFTISK